LVTRQALLDTSTLGAMYYEMVYLSSRRLELEALARRVSYSIQDGMQDHLKQEGARVTAAPLVVPISDWLGDADYPDPKIWDVPWELYLRAADFLARDETESARPLLLAAAVLSKQAAALLAEYQDRTTAGAATAVKWLNRAKTAGEIAQFIAIGASGIGFVAGGEAVAGAAAAGGEGAVEVDELLSRYFAKDAELAARVNRPVPFVKMPKGTTSRGLNPKGPGGNWGIGMGRESWL
jgi:hypothetical protein